MHEPAPPSIILVGPELSLSLSNIDDAAIVGGIAEQLARNTTATSLDLCGQRVSNAGAIALAEALASNSTLTELDLAMNRIGVEGARALLNLLRTKRNRVLETLDLSGNEEVGLELLCEIANALESNQLGEHPTTMEIATVEGERQSCL